jgi:hypothetical protein
MTRVFIRARATAATSLSGRYCNPFAPPLPPVSIWFIVDFHSNLVLIINFINKNPIPTNCKPT